MNTSNETKELHEFGSFLDDYLQLDTEYQAFILRLMKAYVARQEGRAMSEDLTLIDLATSGSRVGPGRAGNSRVHVRSQKGTDRKGRGLAKRKRDAEGG